MDQIFEESLLERKKHLYQLINKHINCIISQICPPYAEDPLVLHEWHIKSLKIESSVNKLKLIVQEFEPSPRLLDTHLSSYLNLLISEYTKTHQLYEDNPFARDKGARLADAVYHFANVRGFKKITNYFPSDIYLLPQLTQWFHSFDNINDNEKSLILMWLCNLVMAPFDLNKIYSDVALQLFDLSMLNLKSFTNGSKNQIICSILISRMFSRPDQSLLLNRYLDTLDLFWEKNKLGNMMILNKVMKNVKLKEVSMIEKIIGNELSRASGKAHNLSNLEYLYLIKLINRLCQEYLSKSESVEFSKISSLINALFQSIMRPLIQINKFDVNLRYGFAKTLSNISISIYPMATNYSDQIIEYVLSELNLDIELNKFQLQLDIDFQVESISKFQTVLLYLGYLSLKKQLPLKYTPAICSLTHHTLFFNQKYMNTVVGSQVKDSSCFVLWALLKNLTPVQFTQYFSRIAIESVLFDLIKTSIFDTDIIIRRCSIAVLQEYVGRFGFIIFNSCVDANVLGKFIIDFVELFNPIAVSTLTKSSQIAVNLVHLGIDPNLFITPFLVKLINNSENPFEYKKLYGETLSNVLNTDYTNKIKLQWESPNAEIDLVHIFTNPIKSDIHGSLYALSAISLIAVDEKIDNTLMDIEEHLISTSFKIDIHHSSSIIMAEEFVFFSFANLNKRQQNVSQSFISLMWDNIFQIFNVTTNNSLVNKIQVLFENLHQDHLTDSIYKKLSHILKNGNSNLCRTIGYLSHIPVDFMSHILELISSTAIHAESRAFLISSLGHYFSRNTLDIGPLECIVNMLDDYTITVQGDVGSKVRNASIEFLGQNFAIMALQNSCSLLFDTNSRLMRISCETMNSLRLKAVSLLENLNQLKPFELTRISLEEYFVQILNFRNKLINYDNSMFWEGYVFSVGGSSDGPTKNASTIALIKHLQSIPNTAQVFNQLLNLVSIPKDTGVKSLTNRQRKRLRATLNTFVVLFEANVQFPENFEYNKLYIYSYNLHINTTDFARISLVIKIFKFLGMRGDKIGQASCKRLSWLCCSHPNKTIRELSSEAIYEIGIELNIFETNKDFYDILTTTRWEDDKQYQLLEKFESWLSKNL